MRAAWAASAPGLLVIFIFSVFINILKFAAPMYLLHVLDRVLASRSIETLIMLTIAVLAAIAAAVSLEAVRRRMFARWGIWIEQRFGSILLERSLNQSPSIDFATARQSLSDLTTLRSFATRRAAAWIDVVWAPLFFIGVYMIHPLLGIITLVAVGVLIVAGIVQELISRNSRRAARQASGAAGQIVLGAERNIETIGALSMSANVIDKWRRSVGIHHDERDRSDASATFYAMIRRGIGMFLRIILIAVGIWLVIQNALTIGGMFAARLMAGFGYRIVEQAARNWVNLQEAVVAYNNIKKTIEVDHSADVSFGSTIFSSSIMLDDISFRYQSGRDYVFRRFKLELRPGELVLIIGRAATGKTTISRLLVGRLTPNRGRINIGGIELMRLPPEVRAELIGYLPQHAELFNGTVRQNIARMSEGAFEDVVAAANRAGVHETILRLPQGYDTEISDDEIILSGSERKRIALARAFYKSPRLLVLDEPYANLDQPSRKILERALREFKNEGVSIVVTQTAQSPRLQKYAGIVVTLGKQNPEVVYTEKTASKTEAQLPSTRLRSVS
jgi:PrtD family type I secretion system ABC transporter